MCGTDMRNGASANHWLAIGISLQLLTCTSSSTNPTGSPTAPSAGSKLEAQIDRFGVRMIYPTVRGGREWYLAAPPRASDPEWKPDSASDVMTATAEAGVFHSADSPRFSVHSPLGKAWWRNVEMTGYVRYGGPVAGQLRPHWEWYARGERHTAQPVDPGSINDGVRAPEGTPTWPGYPFDGIARVNARCLATSYHGNVYADGEVHLEKEISFTQGYGREVRGLVKASALSSGQAGWFGFKFVVRNFRSDQGVALEAWLDRDGIGHWIKVSEATDSGDWLARDPNLDGCGAAPFRYSTGQVLTWAAPWVTFRTDSTSSDYRWLSVREVASLS